MLLQNDTGSAVVYPALIFVLFREGLSGNILLLGVYILALFMLTVLFNQFLVIAGLVAVAILLYVLYRKVRKNLLRLVLMLIFVVAAHLEFTSFFSMP